MLGGAPEKETAQVRGILEELREGRVDRAMFTSNANSYFNDIVLKDFAASLGGVGKAAGRYENQ